MSKYAIAGLVLATLRASAVAAAEPPKGIFLKAPSPDKVYPRFHVGVTGLYVTIEKGLVVTVDGTESETPAAGKFSNGEVLTAVNGKSLAAPDPRVVLGEALTAAEATDGELVFTVRRGGGTVPVTLTIPVLGPYSKSWPLDCRKSETIARQTAEFIAQSDMLSGTGLLNSLAGIYLLSTGDDKYLPLVQTQVERFPKGKASSHTWNNGYAGILLGEYYLRTGDKSALPALKGICDDSRDRQYFGGWNHWEGAGTGYVQGGLMNPAGIQILTTLLLAAECGVEVDRGTLLRALRFFYRFAGHGAVPYGDHRNEGWLSSNGKNGMLAAALSLLPGEVYQQASQYLAEDACDSYRWLLSGHTGGGFDVIWRGLGGVHCPGDKWDHYRRCMDKLAWYYDLSRLPGGGFDMVGGERYAGPKWGSPGLGLAYTAPRRTLRITGAPPTRFSRPVEAPEQPWGRPADRVFLSTDYCDGYGEETLEPHEIYDRLGDAYTKPRADATPDRVFYVKMLRHYNMVARTEAAAALGHLGDADALAAALEDADPRVRRAGADGISEYRFWWGGGKGTLPPDVVSEKCLPGLLKILRDPHSALFEVDGALNALGFAKVDDVAANLDLVRQFLKHEEWWLREASWRALRPVFLDEKLLPTILPDLIDCLTSEIHVMPRRVYLSELLNVLKNREMKDEVKQQVVAGILRAMRDTKVESGYKEPIGVTAKFETFRYLNLKEDPTPALEAVKFIEPYYESLDTLPSVWLFAGAKWGNPGLIACAEKLGNDAGPLIEAFKRMAPILEAKAQGGKGKQAPLIMETVGKIRDAIAAFERK